MRDLRLQRARLGMLVKKGLIDMDMVEDLFAGRIKWFWEGLLGPQVQTRREILKDQRYYDSIEYLYKEIKKREQQQ